jgi:Malectin domain
VTVPAQKIEGTLDSPIYLGGVRGIAHCVFPVTQKLYELHLHFAETSDLPAATRLASLSINAGPPIGVDVVDDAGGNGIATSTVVTGVAPENDGSIHIDLTSEVSLLNAVEILPAPSASQLPVRIVVNSKSYVDSSNQFWMSDHYFSGGRYGLPPPDFAKRANLGLYESDRIGRFRYSIPTVPLGRYRVRLYFREPWFGKENGGIGGPGSRVFDVACNGAMLLKNFDILAESSSAPVVKTFDNIQASAGGRIELSFMPVVNYAVVNAIEVLPED